MAGGDEILVDEEARGIMLALGKHDPEDPRASGATQATGPTFSQGTHTYRRTMEAVGSVSQEWFVNYLQIIRQDCANGLKALEDFSAQDAEIMALLRKYEEEAASVAPQRSSGGATLPGGGPSASPGVVSPADSDALKDKSWGESFGG